MAGKFTIRSRRWDIGVLVGSLLLLAVGFGGLFLFQGEAETSPTPVSLFVIALGIVTFGFFAGPGLVYVLRKRVKSVKKALPGGTMAWIRSHLYLPILALVAAFVHATVVPFRPALSSGKVLLLLGILVSIAGLFRHHLIGIQKEALNVNVAISKLTTGQPRAFRRLVADYTDNLRPLSEIEAAMAGFDVSLQERWKRIKELTASVEKHFPRTGGQRPHIRHYKVWRSLHTPLTIALFVVLGFHVWDVLGGTEKFIGDEKSQFASAAECGACHSTTFTEWGASSMAHAQTSTIMEAQLPVTLGRNQEFADDLGGDQEDRVDDFSKTCINCHAQVGARFAENIDALLPLGSAGTEGVGEDGVAVGGGGDQVQSDGVGCVVCHTQESPPAELAAAGELAIDNGSAADYGTMYGPIFEDPGPLPVRMHGIGAGDDEYFDDHLAVSEMCGACHNVKIDMDGDGLSALDVDDDDLRSDSDGDFNLDSNEVDDNDGIQGVDDLVLQTTFDEWQDYVAGFDEVTARYDGSEFPQTLDDPLGCVDCHMPTEGDGTSAVVDHAPGLLPRPEREHRSHTFVGVDYDLDPEAYEKYGLPDDALERVLAERATLLQSAITLEVVDPGPVSGDVLTAEVVVRNNLLAHGFPTGFAFARQFWLEVSAETVGGQEVCLLPPADGVGTPCASGVVGDGFDEPGTNTDDGADEDLRQCDPLSVADAIGGDPSELLNGNVEFAAGASFPADDCDPWLTNFQKILTDADIDGDGVFTEVPFQPFAPNAVQIRGRVATQSPMTELQPVRLREIDGELFEDEEGVYVYDFDTSSIPDGEVVVVTARMRFRHLPPYFVRALEEEQEDLGDDVPEDARIDADELLENMVITDIVEAGSGDGPQLACDEGPQNEEDGTIFDCLPEDVDPVGAMAGDDIAALHHGADGGGNRPAAARLVAAVGGPRPVLWYAVGIGVVLPTGVLYRRRRATRS